MKRAFQLIALTITCYMIIGHITEKDVYSNIDGAAPKVAGSPFDVSGQTCANNDCHSTPATTIDDLITSNVPVTGYVPGSVYTITATVTDPAKTRFGFEMTPQASTGALAGSITITDATRTQFTSPTLGNKYLTHTEDGIEAPTHTATWSFNWQAPSVGTGDVTVYGAFNYTNSNDERTGDSIHTSTLVIPEGTTGVGDPILVTALNVYPNPASASIQLDYYLQKSGVVKIDLLDLEGRTVDELFHSVQLSGAHHDAFPINEELSSGSYLLRLLAGEQSLTRKVLIF